MKQFYFLMLIKATKFKYKFKLVLFKKKGILRGLNCKRINFHFSYIRINYFN